MSDFKIVKLLDPVVQLNTNIKPTGVYSAAATYGVGDSVSYGYSSYIAIQPTTGNIPTNTTYWQLLATSATNKLTTTARNQTGTTIPKGTVVYFSGVSGNVPTLALSQANTELGSTKTIGITAVSIANNTNGEVIIFGLADSLDTSAYTAGSALWLSPTVTGGMTMTKPSAPNHMVFIGFCTRSHPTDGTIEVKVQNGFELEELHNVAISSVANGQTLKYESATSLWKNVTLTSSDVGLGNVPNVDATNPANIVEDSTHRFVTDAEKTTWNGKENAITAGTTSEYFRGDKTFQTLDKTAVGLSNVDNTSDLSKPISTATQTALNAKVNNSSVGAANGVASLDGTGRVPSSELPSYVDDVLEFATFSAFPSTGESGKIYIAIDTNLTYRWSGSIYVIIASSLALGETSSTAYRGDRGKIAYDHSQITIGNPHGTTKNDVGLSNVPNVDATNRSNHTGTQLSTTISDFTEAAQDSVNSALTNTSTVSFSYNDSLNQITADVNSNSITDSLLSAGINANKIGAGTVSNTEFGYLDGLTGSIQTQLSGKYNNPIGLASQYIKGDGTFAAFPNIIGGGGGGAVYYLNGGISQGTISGNAYYQLSTAANNGTSVNFNITGNGTLASFITDAGSPNLLAVPAGIWVFEIYLAESSSGGTLPEIYAEVQKYNGTTFTTIATGPIEQITNGTTKDLYTFSASIPSGTTLAASDRIAINLKTSNAAGRTVTLYTQNGNISAVQTTFTTGIASINGLTISSQYFGVGTSGTNFGISSTGDTHTFNLPSASATNRGALTSSDWTTFNNKEDAANKSTNTALGTSNTLYPTQNAVKSYADNALANKVSFTDMQKTQLAYVSPSGSNTIGDGSFARPYLTIAHTIANTTDGATIFLLPGLYTEATVIIPANTGSRAFRGFSANATELQNGISHTSSAVNTGFSFDSININSATLNEAAAINGFIYFTKCWFNLTRTDNNSNVAFTSTESNISSASLSGAINIFNEALVIGAITCSGGFNIFENCKFVTTLQAQGATTVRMLDCELFGATVFVNGTIVSTNTPSWEVDLSTEYLGTYTGSVNKTVLANISTALGFTPEDVANKSTNTSLGTSDTLYPSQNAVKVYTDTVLTNHEAAADPHPQYTTDIESIVKALIFG